MIILLTKHRCVRKLIRPICPTYLITYLTIITLFDVVLWIWIICEIQREIKCFSTYEIKGCEYRRKQVYKEMNVAGTAEKA